MIILNEFEGENDTKKVKRENIYAGVLLQSFTPKVQIFDEQHNELSSEDLKERGIVYFQVSSELVCRKMLFQKTEEDVADDLLYYSPKYQIEGFTPKVEVNNNFIISRPTSLEELLAHFNFKKDLTTSDIRRIYGMFLRKWKEGFYLRNCELFGYKEAQPEEFKYFEHGIEVTDPKKLKQRIAEQRLKQMMGHRLFGFSGKEHPIPSNTWELRSVIDNRKTPHPVEKEKVLIKTRIHTLF